MTTGKNLYRIFGRVVDRETRHGVPGLRVEAWDRDLIFDDLLGHAQSDADGAFEMSFGTRDFRDFLEEHPDIFFKVLRGDVLLADTRNQVLWNVRQPEVRVVIPVWGVETPTKPMSFQVAGRVTTGDGRAIEDLIVEAWDQRLRGERLLGSGVTDAKGRYLVPYDPALDGKARADLMVRVLDPMAGRAELARSAVFYQAEATLVVDLRVVTAEVRRPSEYDRLLKAIAPLLGDTPLAELDPNAVVYLAGRSGWDARTVAMAAESARLSAASGIPTAHYYAMLRAGLTAETIPRVPESTLRGLLDGAMADGLINAAHPIDPTLAIQGQEAVAKLAELLPAASVSKLGDILDLSLSGEPRQRFLGVFRATAGAPEQLWAALAREGFDGSTIERLKTVGKLGFLTRQNAPLVGRLLQIEGLSRAEDLPAAGLYRADAWLPLIADDAPGGIGAQAYAVGLAAQVDLAYPNLVVADLVRRQEIALPSVGDGGAGEVAAFLRSAQGAHRIGHEPVKGWTGYQQLSLQAQDDVRRLERLYQMSPSNASMIALSGLGLDSAYQIVQESEATFIQKYAQAFPSTREAMMVHRKAQAVHSTALNLATLYLSYGGAPNVYALTGSAVKQGWQFIDVPGAPTLESLLNNMDYCACEHCKSVLGPAAYFVELLHFIDSSVVPPGKRNPLDVLQDRRPDLEHLRLSCENTNVAVPYVDLVNEALEHYVVNGSLAAYTGHDTAEGASSADLLADPAFVEAGAYDQTKAEVYPHPLPFDMPLAALRLLMRAWDTTLPAALRRFGAAADARREVLGLNDPEYRILTDVGFRALPEYFGEPPGAGIEALNAAVADGKTFCRRTAISYEELVGILKTRFINPGLALVPRLEALDVSLLQLQAWYEGSLSDGGLQALFPAGIDPADYRGDILQWLGDNQGLIMGLILLTDVGAEPAECDFAALELRFALPDMAANRLTAIAYHKLLRFIRLWKRLGWSIELTDRVVTTFLGVAPEALTLANLDGEMAALLARISNFRWLMERLEVPDKRLNDWLRVWDPDLTAVERGERVAHLLRLGITDLDRLVEITGLDPLADDLDTDRPSVHGFLDAWLLVKGMGLKVADLSYLLRHGDEEGRLAPDEGSVLRDLKALRDPLSAIAAEFEAPPASADLTFARNRMALVYDAAVVDRFIGLIGGGTRYEAPFATTEEMLPEKLTQADPAIGFDAVRKVLSYPGVMDAGASAALGAAADTLVLADMGVIDQHGDLDAFIAAFKLAVQGLAEAGAADVQGLVDEYPELQPVYAAAFAAADPAARAEALVSGILPALRPRMEAIALRTTLASRLQLDLPLVDLLTGNPAVLHADGDTGNGVLEDFLALATPTPLNTNQAHALYLDPPASDDYLLYVAAPTGTTITLNVADTEVIPATPVGASVEVATAMAVPLQAGALAPAVLTLAGLPPGASAELRWRTNAIAKGPIPSTRLYADDAVQRARASLLRLQKTAALLGAMPLTRRELHRFAAVDPDTAGFLNGLDTDGSIGAGHLHAQWAKLAWVAWYCHAKADEPEADVWVGLLEDPEQQTPQGGFLFAGSNGWRDQDLTDTLAHFGLTIADLTTLRRFRLVREVLDLIGGTGQPAADFLAWAVATPDAALIDQIKQRLRARLADLAWRTTLQGVNDRLRNQRRDALVSYILRHAPPTPDIDTADKLYEHFLIDVEMDACMKTSRIRLALSAVQLFITRCLMNLEPEAVLSSSQAEQWAWMKRYRVWEANRKIFLWPENWLEPELRDNKSPFFRELESELLKADIDDELAEAAYLDYLYKLDEVARLEIIGSFLQEQDAGHQDDDILHLFGRTNGTSRQIYYRRFEYGYWTPWEKVGLNIQGDLLFPMIWKDRLFLFWMTAATKPQEGDRNQKPEDMAGESWGTHVKIDVELSLFWGEYYQGKWASPKSSELAHPIRITGLTTFDASQISLAARTEPPSPDVSERLVMMLHYPEGGPMGSWYKLVFTSRNLPPLVARGLDPSLFTTPFVFNWGSLLARMDVQQDSNAFRERSAKVFKVQIQQPQGATAPKLEETLLTKGNALFGGFRLLPLMHPVENQWEAPFVYSDEHSLFSVHPDEHIQSVPNYDGFFWNDSLVSRIPPELLHVPRLEERPVVPDPLGPVTNPLDILVNPAIERVIRDNSVFFYQGTTFDANGIAKQEILR